MRPLSKLFSPIRVGAMELRNRIIMAPMGNRLSNDDGTASPKLIDYFEARAKGGVGLIILGSTSIDRVSPFENMPVLWDDRFIPGLRVLTKAIHAHGAKVMPQLCHAGGVSQLTSTVMPASCSLEDIKRFIKQFTDAARRAREAGFDGIELHAAHGWMVLGAFSSALRNMRTDAYGGSVEGRIKLLQKVIRSIREQEGQDFPIIMRISAEELVPGGRTLRETQYIAPLLVEAGLDALNVSAGLHGEPELEQLGTFVAFSKAVKEVVEVPVTVVHRINNPRFAEDILNRNEADLIVMGRALLADPELPNKAKEGRFDDIAPCVWCGACMSRRSVFTCLVNPALGRERKMVITAAAKAKKVLVAGGGPAGLKAASVAALRGHEVTLYEKGTDLGGQFNLASVPPTKQEMTRVIQYLSVQMEKAGVKVQLNTEVTPELVEKTKPDVVIIATGGEPIVPDIPGAKGGRIVTAHDVLAGRVTIQPGNVLVIGGGMVGCGVADFLADLGDSMPDTRTAVTIVEMLEEIGMDVNMTERAGLLQRLRDKGVKTLTLAKVKEFLEDGIVIVRGGKEDLIRGADSIILAMGAKSVDRLSNQIKDKVAEVYVIGDAKEPRQAVEAIAEGMEVGRNI